MKEDYKDKKGIRRKWEGKGERGFQRRELGN
jgi:hypothetical protein